MLGLLLFGLAGGSFICYWVRKNSRMAQIILDAAAMLAIAGLFIPASAAVIGTLVDDTVYMTQVHEVLLDPMFLLGGAYLGPYALGRLLECVQVPAQR
ncbi:hypothetical protein K0T92_07035 [Paenibacillus oenotherae]|uniref:Uncharacterized protein n=1 Tax=Paenibacillus oenotherae TaxID=1435645 RepID=A0ABS7D3N0_9BACL|nr:hypothetical protein [Paenibacillus oenotherae]MBW7474495.1 hypothetical protein [Paenibacillus oenotherae]